MDILYFFNDLFKWLNLVWQFESGTLECQFVIALGIGPTHFLSMTIYGTNTSQGSVATYDGGMLNNHFTANLLDNLAVKELWKSAEI